MGGRAFWFRMRVRVGSLQGIIFTIMIWEESGVCLQIFDTHYAMKAR